MGLSCQQREVGLDSQSEFLMSKYKRHRTTNPDSTNDIQNLKEATGFLKTFIPRVLDITVHSVPREKNSQGVNLSQQNWLSKLQSATEPKWSNSQFLVNS